MRERKALTGVQVKDDAQGLVEAVFATLNVVDGDGDVTLPGAFEDGAPTRISAFGHTSWGGALPVGKGVIRMDGDAAILSGQFFMDTECGRDTFATVKGLGDLGEWSYGFDVLDSETGDFAGEKVRLLKRLQVHEVSPVLLGAGVDTRTLVTKSEGVKFSEQAGAAIASVDALIERAADVVTLRAEQGKSLGDESLGLLDQLGTSMARLSVVLTDGPKEGRVLSGANRDKLATLLEAMGSARAALQALLAETDPAKARRDLLLEAARFEQIKTNIR